MVASRSGIRTVLFILICLVMAFGAIKVINHRIKSNSITSYKSPNSFSPGRHNPVKNNQLTANKYVVTAEYKYLIPDGWVQVDSSQIQSSGASSAISTTNTPITQFRVVIKSGEDIPDNLEDYKSSTLEIIEQFQNYQALDNGFQKISGEVGYRYKYQLGSDNLAEQELIIVLHKGRAFSLLFTGAKFNFDTQSPAFKDIINSFQLL